MSQHWDRVWSRKGNPKEKSPKRHSVLLKKKNKKLMLPEGSKEEMNVLKSCERSWHQQTAYTASGERSQGWTRHRAGQEVNSVPKAQVKTDFAAFSDFPRPSASFFIFSFLHHGIWDLVPCLGTEFMPLHWNRILTTGTPGKFSLLYFLSLGFYSVQHAYKKITSKLLRAAE